MLQNNLIPVNCPSCNNILQINDTHIKCNNPDCPEKNIQLIASWIVKCGFDQVAESTIRLLYNATEIKSIKDLYSLTKNDLQSLPGIGEKKIVNLLKQIEKSKSMTIVEFLGRLSIDLIGERAIEKLGIESVEDFWNFNDSTYVIGQNLIAYRNENKDMIEQLLKVLNVTNIIKKESTNMQKVCMTGTGPRSRKELIKEIEAKGYEFVDSVTKDVSILICENIEGTSSKLVKARKNGTKLISYEEFFK